MNWLREFLQIVTEEHNFVNLFWFNFHKVDEGVYRSAQLTPWRLRKVVERYQIKSVLNLRKKENYLYQREEEICWELGVCYRVYSIASRTLPKPEEVEELAQLLRELPKPILIHCKAGADRTGFVSVLWHLLQGRGVEEAIKKELRARYAYFPVGRAGKILELFRNFPGGDFLEWYRLHRDRIEEGFQPTPVGELLYEKLLRRE